MRPFHSSSPPPADIRANQNLERLNSPNFAAWLGSLLYFFLKKNAFDICYYGHLWRNSFGFAFAFCYALTSPLASAQALLRRHVHSHNPNCSGTFSILHHRATTYINSSSYMTHTHTPNIIRRPEPLENFGGTEPCFESSPEKECREKKIGVDMGRNAWG